MESTTRHALHVRKSPPSQDDLVRILGKVQHQHFAAAADRLKLAGVGADWSWAGQTEGWVLVYKKAQSTVCRLMLSRLPLSGQVAVGRQLHDAIVSGALLPASVLKKLEGTPLDGSQRTLELGLDTGTGLSQFMALVEAKLAVLATAPRG
ncbi:MAG: DUF3788 family protein [Candidatus Wallbacteria bacterium]|nr:DUF3788 family protein [Candidatus Wallbacteria bacterium]